MVKTEPSIGEDANRLLDLYGLKPVNKQKRKSVLNQLRSYLFTSILPSIEELCLPTNVLRHLKSLIAGKIRNV